MKEFFSNAWVISIISGIVVFFITNFFIMIQNRKQHKKQIYEANAMILNSLRGYVVDNGLPPEEIIKAVKHSAVRQYNIKYDDLLSNKSLCEELVADIIGNIYISNENKIKYINMLQEYLKHYSNTQKDNIQNYNDQSNATIRNKTSLKKTIKDSYLKNDFFYSAISAIITCIASIVILFISKFADEIGSDIVLHFDFKKIFLLLLVTFFSVLIPIIYEWINKKK